ncbi:hypothetical protein [Flavobacterium lindanitolerans]|uniref:hypothetical protein n=1 Tax=Flavobacterium lindanitolerans TaxID=428988 RepID=UPI0023F04BEF|nr:hypothetical protein [Flavobacterium lindanitolerans]
MANLEIYRTQQHGLNGWFGRVTRGIVKGIKKVVENIPVVGTIVKEISNELKLDEWIKDDENWNWRSDGMDYEPTEAETAILNAFAERLKPFYYRLSTDLSAGLQMQSLSDKILVINSCLNRMAVVKAYFASNETAGLSKDGVMSRNEIILQVFNDLYIIINRFMENEGLAVAEVSISINQDIADQFSGLILGSLQSSYPSQNYRINTQGTPTGNDIVLNLPVNPNLPTKGDSGIVPSKSAPETPSDPEAETDKPGMLKKLAFVAGIAALGYLLFSGDSGKAKSKPKQKTKTKKVTI